MRLTRKKGHHKPRTAPHALKPVDYLDILRYIHIQIVVVHGYSTAVQEILNADVCPKVRLEVS